MIASATLGLVLAATGILPTFVDGPNLPIGVSLATAVVGVFLLLGVGSVPLAAAGSRWVPDRPI